MCSKNKFDKNYYLIYLDYNYNIAYPEYLYQENIFS